MFFINSSSPYGMIDRNAITIAAANAISVGSSIDTGVKATETSELTIIEYKCSVL